MGPTAGSSGLALIIGISEGTLGGLVGVQAFFAAADHVVVWGARLKSMELFGYPHFPSYSYELVGNFNKKVLEYRQRLSRLGASVCIYSCSTFVRGGLHHGLNRPVHSCCTITKISTLQL